LSSLGHILKTMATAAAVAIVVYSCKSKIPDAEPLDLESTPLQVVDSLYLVQTNKGQVQMRVFAPIMERYETAAESYENFPKGINVYAYKEDGILESTIVADEAYHDNTKKGEQDIWKAYGNVVVKNIVNHETMETDTLYWDRKAQEIYTDCYIRMYSPKGFMQGYGMRSDERARNAILLRPFNGYGVVVEDSTKVIIDSANFIGPLLKK